MIKEALLTQYVMDTNLDSFYMFVVLVVFDFLFLPFTSCASNVTSALKQLLLPELKL